MNFQHPNYSVAADAFEKVRRSISRRFQAARRTRQRATERVADLESEVLFLNLVNRTLVRLLVDKGLVTPEELTALLESVDLEDGTADGAASGDDLARDFGYEELPVEREPEPPETPKPSKKRFR